MRFLDDVRQLKAHAVLLLGIMSFAGMVAYYSGNMFKDRGSSGQSRASADGPSRSRSGVGKSMGLMLADAAKKVQEETQTQLIINRYTEAASAMAQRALAEETKAKNSHRVTGVIVFKDHGMNLNLALRSVAKRSFIREVLLVHDLGPESASMPREWKDPPTNVFGKKIKYLARRGDRNELLKFDACASDADPRNDVCYYQAPTRDSSNYLESLWA